MKKLIMVLAALMLTVCSNAQTLKDYTIGETLYGESQIMTTVAGIPGILVAYTLEDNTIYAIAFIPSSDGVEINRVYLTDLNRLVEGIEKNYDIDLVASYNEWDELKTYFNNSVEFMIMVDYNKYMSPPYEISLFITDNELNKRRTLEQQNEADSDF